MSRLIRYDDAIERLGAYLMADAQIDWGGSASTDIEDWKELADMILNAVPTIDAVSVVHGEWIWHEDDDICNCSECEFEIDATGCIEPMEYVGVFRYCPNCGARMKGADDE